MKYVSIDIETTGLNPDTCQILEFAAVVDDLVSQPPLETLPKFQSYVVHDVYCGEPYALSMHCEIFKKLSKWQDNGVKVCYPADLMTGFRTFLTTLAGYAKQNNAIKINVAGKNFANFDSKFLERLPGYYTSVRFHHRVLDPVMLYFDPKQDKEELPSSEKCLTRAGLNSEVKHTALEDAMMVVKLLRHKYPK